MTSSQTSSARNASSQADASTDTDGGSGAGASKHAAKRRQTRSNFLRAASELIAQGRLASFSIDDVCQLAGISRAGFYLHFQNKAALLDALQEEKSEWYVRQFQKFDASTADHEEKLMDWLRHFASGFEKAEHAFLLFTARTDGLPGLGARTRGQAVLALGAQVPAFRLVRSDGSIDEEQRIALLLMVFQIEQLCIHLAVDKPFDSELHLRVLARRILRFGRDEADT